MVKNLIRDHLEEVENRCRILEEKGLIKQYSEYGIEYLGPAYTVSIVCDRYSYDDIDIVIEHPNSYKGPYPFTFGLRGDYYRVCCEPEYYQHHTLADFRKMPRLEALFVFIDFFIDHFSTYTNKAYCEKWKWDISCHYNEYFHLVDQQTADTQT